MTRATNDRLLAMAGYVMDYELLSSSMSNHIFLPDTTYYASNPVYLYGQTVMDSAVIKINNTNFVGDA